MALMIADLGEHYIVHLSGEEVYVCMHACMYVCVHVCMFVCLYVCTTIFLSFCALFLRSPSPVPPRCRAAVAMRTGVQDTTHHCRK